MLYIYMYKITFFTDVNVFLFLKCITAPILQMRKVFSEKLINLFHMYKR